MKRSRRGQRRDPKKGPLPPEVVNFARGLIESGVHPSFFNNFASADVSPHHFRSFELALALASLCRIAESELDHSSSHFRPIALDWYLGKEEPKNHLLDFDRKQLIEMKQDCVATYTNQLQPKLDPTKVFVINSTFQEEGMKRLQDLCHYGFKDNYFPSFEGNEYLRKNRIGLGLSHALEVAKEFSLCPLTKVNEITPICGPRSFGRSLFILIDYLAYTDKHDTEGTPTFGWLELRVISKENCGDNRLAINLHNNLNRIIPKDSLIAVANIQWFKNPRPSEY